MKVAPNSGSSTIIPISSIKSTSSTDHHMNMSNSEEISDILSFHNINYIVDTRKELDETQSSPGMNCCKSKEPKQILFNVSGRFTTGLNAILGPTGCGKTSLLDILADRKDPHSISGPVLINESYRQPSFKYTVGYVVQDNIMCESFTVRENLTFSANLRLPKGLSREEINDRVSSVIDELALEHCADQYMGTPFIRGVSGGEKKRTCIGMELILSPSILFLDEPTTGLDASTAYSVMACLKELSQRGRTIIFSIHQPRYSIFKLFDSVMFMCKGRSLFHGPTHDVIPYFSEQGYKIEEHDNPADFVLDILIDANRKPDILSKLNDAYVQSSGHKEMLALIENKNDLDKDERSKRERHRYKNELSHSILTEVWYLSKRTMINSIRNYPIVVSQIACALITAILVAMIYYNLARTIDPGIQNYLGATFFIVVTQMFSGLTSMDPLIKDRELFLHEHAGGYYKFFSFFLAKVICDTVLMRIAPSIIFSVIAYFVTGFGRTIQQFAIFYLTILTTQVFGSSVGFFVAVNTSVLGVAMVIGLLFLTSMMVFSGFLAHLSSIPTWLRWLQWVSAVRYAQNVLLINELKGLTFCLADMPSICPMTGEDVLARQLIDYASPWDLWKYYLGLVIMTLVFLILAFIQLLRIRKPK